MADWNVSVKNGRVFTTPTLTDEEEAALAGAWENDPTKSKSRYYKFRRTIVGKDTPDRIAAIQAAGYRVGKPHWCGGSDVLYSLEEWERWDKANPEACTNLKGVEQLAEPEPEPEPKPKPMPIETHQWGKVTEKAFTTRLDTTGNAVRVYGVLACKAGRTRRAWMSQTTVAERLGISSKTVRRAIKRLIAADLIKVVDRIVVDPTKGTWLPIYLVAPLGTSDLPEGTPSVQSGTDAENPMGQSGGPDGTPTGTRWDTQQSDIQFLDLSSSSISEASANSPLRGSPPQTETDADAPWKDYPGGWRAFLKDKGAAKEEAEETATEARAEGAV